MSSAGSGLFLFFVHDPWGGCGLVGLGGLVGGYSYIWYSAGFISSVRYMIMMINPHFLAILYTHVHVRARIYIIVINI